MADYNAILRRTLDGLGTTTPELREKLFGRARATIARQLESADPPMSPQSITEQKAQLEAAIAEIENEYRANETPDELPVPSAATAMPQQPAEQSPPEVPEFVEDPVDIAAAGDHAQAPAAAIRQPRASGGQGKLIALVVGLLVIGGGAAALWINKDPLMAAFGEFTSGEKPMTASQTASKPATDPSTSNVKTGEKLPASTTVEPTVTEKFDQRLNENGEETGPEPIPDNNDTLPAGVEPSPVTTTRIVVPGATETAGEVGETLNVASNQDAATPTSDTNVAVVAQKGLLYEEGAAQNQNSVDVGSVVWSMVQESPGEGLPLEPAIRARVEIDSRGLVLVMTIKRNADKALPASHIIELVFTVPDDFNGGGIEKIQRFVFKQSEEARGEALVGVPATIADGIFLIALNNLPEAVARNTALMKTQEWIDIPLGYRTGRRALITIEKGVPGERVFNEAFAVWEQAG